MGTHRTKHENLGYLSVNPHDQLNKYGEPRAESRMSSFDHCYSYFRTAFENNKHSELASEAHIQRSCLHLGFYLASWGMYRGSGELYKFSSAGLSDVVSIVSGATQTIWNLDVDGYTADSIKELLAFAEKLRQAFPSSSVKPGFRASDTLVTKTLLGVFGNTPAFDSYFKKGLGCSQFDEKSLLRVSRYWDAYRDVVEGARVSVRGFDGSPNKFRYSQAKVIDMVFFARGGGI